MAATTMTMWVCDRCGGKVEMTGVNQPPHWFSLILVTPPKADPDSATFKVHLCSTCEESFSKWYHEFKEDKEEK